MLLPTIMIMPRGLRRGVESSSCDHAGSRERPWLRGLSRGGRCVSRGGPVTTCCLHSLGYKERQTHSQGDTWRHVTHTLQHIFGSSVRVPSRPIRATCSMFRENLPPNIISLRRHFFLSKTSRTPPESLKTLLCTLSTLHVSPSLQRHAHLSRPLHHHHLSILRKIQTTRRGLAINTTPDDQHRLSRRRVGRVRRRRRP